MHEIPKFKKLLWNDYTLFGSLISGIIFAAIDIYLFFSEPNISYFVIFCALLLLMMFLIVYRTIVLFHLFHHGVKAEAVISGIFHYRQQIRIGLTFQIDGVEYHHHTFVMSNHNSRKLHKGMMESILVDPKNTKRIIIISMFQ